MKTENDELRELDAWIAEHVMGWTPNKSQSLKYRRAWNVPGQELRWTGEARLPELYECDHPEDEMFHPTTNNADAMAVLKACVEKLRDTHF